MLFIFKYLNLDFTKTILSLNKVLLSLQELCGISTGQSQLVRILMRVHICIFPQSFLLVISIYDYLCQPKSKR